MEKEHNLRELWRSEDNPTENAIIHIENRKDEIEEASFESKVELYSCLGRITETLPGKIMDIGAFGKEIVDLCGKVGVNNWGEDRNLCIAHYVSDSEEPSLSMRLSNQIKKEGFFRKVIYSVMSLEEGILEQDKFNVKFAFNKNSGDLGKIILSGYRIYGRPIESETPELFAKEYSNLMETLLKRDGKTCFSKLPQILERVNPLMTKLYDELLEKEKLKIKRIRFV